MAISDCRIHQNALVQAFIQVRALRFHLRKVKEGYFFLSVRLFSSHKVFVCAFIND